MAPAMATARLRKELIKLQKDPPPGIIAEPNEANILKWHYALCGPTGTPFEHGIYIGKLVFPTEYPMKAPSILMVTPSGRFQVNTRLCLSMSDFHPESWNPLWSVASILQGVQSFMASDELTTGGLKATTAQRLALAKASMDYNQRYLGHLFGGNVQEALQAAGNGPECQAAAKKKKQDDEDETATTTTEGTSNDSTTGGKDYDDEEEHGNRRGRGGRGGRERRKTRVYKDSVPETETGNHNDDDKEEEEETTTTAATVLSPQEVEKRKRRNAKKRAKQKAKKAAAGKEGNK